MIFLFLKRRKLRTLLAVTGIALGIGSMVALHAVTEGIIRQHEQLASEFRGDVKVSSKITVERVYVTSPANT